MNYKIINKQVFEQAQLRSVSDVPFTEEELEHGMKLVVAKKDEKPYIIFSGDRRSEEIRRALG